MNSVNWAGKAASIDVEFELKWLLPGGNDKTREVEILLGTDAKVKTAAEVAQSLVNNWKGKYKEGPHVISMGTAVHFMSNVSTVRLRADGSNNWTEVMDDGTACMVPGNPGLCCWRS